MIIDFHTHIFPSFFRNERRLYCSGEPAFELLYKSPDSKMIGANKLIEKMDAEGIDRSVVFGFPWRKCDNFERHNDYVIESVMRHPDRLIGFGCFDPLSKDAAKETERCLKEGLKGIGELAIYDSDLSDDVIRAFRDIMQIADKQAAPVLIHANEPVGHEYPGKAPMTLGRIYTFIKAFPKNRIILAHWGGGIFFYELMKKEVRKTLENVWFDTAASPFLYRPEIYSTAIGIIGAEKILFGSDYPLIPPSRYFSEMKSADLPDDALSLIKGNNACHMLKIPSE